jgi:type IV pilus assembly protein PilV
MRQQVCLGARPATWLIAQQHLPVTLFNSVALGLMIQLTPKWYAYLRAVGQEFHRGALPVPINFSAGYIRRVKPRGYVGFSLVEVLIVIVITAIGLLGLAGLQAVSLKSSKTAHLRSAANQAMADIADRMRSNDIAAKTDRYVTATLTTFGARAGQKPAFTECTSACDTAAVASQDLARWQTAVAQALPEGAGFVLGTYASGYQIEMLSATRRSTLHALAVSRHRHPFGVSFIP